MVLLRLQMLSTVKYEQKQGFRSRAIQCALEIEVLRMLRKGWYWLYLMVEGYF